MATYCIICGKQKSGIQVRNDYVIESIRMFKRGITKDEKGNKLVVCKEDYLTYKKRIEKFKSRQLMYMALGVLFVIFSILSPISYRTIVLDAGILALLYLISLLNYTPDLETGNKK